MGAVNSAQQKQQTAAIASVMKNAHLAFASRKYPQAEQLCRSIVAVDPEHVEANELLGGLALQFKKYAAACTFFERALKRSRKNAVLYNNYGIALKMAERFDEALTAFNKSLKFRKGYFEALNNRGAVQASLGQMDKARSSYIQAIKSNPDFGKAYYNLANDSKLDIGDKYQPLFSRLENRLSKLSADNLINACFALGKFHEDTGNYDIGFDYFLKGNKSRKEALNYSVEQDLQRVQSYFDVFKNIENWTNVKSVGFSSQTPIFILGMPRSGTTLVEQIISGLPQVFGAGELPYLHQVLSGLNVERLKKLKDFNHFPEDLKTDLRNRGRQYVELLQSKSEGEVSYVTDKLPLNFMYVGFIRLLLPNAKIIHCKRNPLDVCLSNFRILFGENLNFTYDLDDLGRFYLAYEKVMEHWEDQFPESILTVAYEDVINDLEGQAHRMAEFCKLDWDSNCLEFYKNNRSVHTASKNQVRQPLYNSGMRRYEKYGDRLSPLKNILKIAG
ncbi:MAG: sulfotransferase [Sneathiellales bacterium]|nr:sulfotransferase [Sneathiellales bacterium]